MSITFQKGEEAKKRVLDAAFQLFLEQGYDKTTMRQIAQRSGVLNGSVYHAFKNKDAIFEQVFGEVLYRVFDKMSSIDTDILTYSLIPVGYELKFASEKGVIGDLIYHANRSWTIYNNMADRMTDNILAYAEKRGWPFSRDRVHRGAITILGATRALVDEYVLSDGEPDLEACIKHIAMFCATIFLVPISNPDDVVKNIMDIIADGGERFSFVVDSFSAKGE